MADAEDRNGMSTIAAETHPTEHLSQFSVFEGDLVNRAFAKLHIGSAWGAEPVMPHGAADRHYVGADGDPVALYRHAAPCDGGGELLL